MTLRLNVGVDNLGQLYLRYILTAALALSRDAFGTVVPVSRLCEKR